MTIIKKSNVIYDSHGRWLYLWGNITSKTAKHVAEFLTETQWYASNWLRPVTILINSAGGDFTASLLIYSMLDSFFSPVITIAYRRACSGAFIVFEAGKERIMMPKAILKFHQAAVRLKENALFGIEQVDDMRYKIKRINNRFCGIIQHGSRQNAKIVKKFFLGEKMVGAEEAIKYNLADKVVPWREIPELPTRAELKKLLGGKI